MNPPATSPWWRHAVLYEVYPRSFQDSDDDGVGDLAGVVRRLPYLAQLGVDAVWIAPFFASPMQDFGYDVSDHCAVAPVFGDLATFDALVAEAHRLGLRVLVDLVLSHTSERHPWFAASRAGRDGPHADWYVWADPRPDGTPPNNWLSIFGGPAWQWDTRREQYYLHNFLASQPDLNLHHAPVQEALLRVARFWLERGVDGFRLDAVNFCAHDPLLRDNPPQPPGCFAGAVHRSNPYARQRHLYDKTQPETLRFLERLRALCDGAPGAVLLGEIGDDHQYRTLADYTAGPRRLHMAYVFRLLERECSAAHLAGVLGEYLRDAGDALVCWSLGSHDVERVASRWAALGGTPRRRAELAATLLMAMPGAKCIYQGEELGLEEADVPFELLRDPFGIAMWPAEVGRDGCRTPMPWRNRPGGGFTAGRPWLPLPPGHLALAAEEQLADPDSVHAFHVDLLRWHRAEPALRDPTLRLRAGTGRVLAFVRGPAGAALLFAFNLSDAPAELVLEAPLAEGAIVAARTRGARCTGARCELDPLGWLCARVVTV